MDRQFNLLLKAVEGDDEKRKILNIKFGVHFQNKIKFIKHLGGIRDLETEGSW